MAKRICRDYEAGLTQKEIAERYRVAQTTVSATVRREGVTPAVRRKRDCRHGPALSQEVISAIYQGADRGLTQKAIATRLGIGQTTVSKVLRRRQQEETQP